MDVDGGDVEVWRVLINVVGVAGVELHLVMEVKLTGCGLSCWLGHIEVDEAVEVAWAGIFTMPTGSPPNGGPSHFTTITRMLTMPHRKMNTRAIRMDRGCKTKGTGGRGGNNEIRNRIVFSIMTAV